MIDTGIGIDEKDHNLISSHSNRPIGSRREYGGTGLGLAISRELAPISAVK